ncbi:N-acetyltransferase family protein [Glutamicibacter sp. FR1]|uniref:GNAT family N-acetyltransferase n=1 Tax=Glutamicibacter sp. FR1 TaxID=3393744 RepID=UPI0039B005CF
MDYRIAAATADRWQDVLQVFGTHGDPSWCKCQYFIDPQWNQGAAANEAALHRQVCEEQVPAGLLAYRGDVPAGWLQFGPSTRYPRFRPRGHQADEDAWVATCFVVRDGYRRQGVATALLAAGIEQAQARGARILRARPTDTQINAKDSAGLFTGVLSTFTAAGFQVLGHNRSLALVELDLSRDG